MMSNATSALVYVIDTIFSLAIIIVLLRILLQWVRADFYNPITQGLVRVSNPVLIPMRRIIPSIGALDTAAFVLLLLLIMANTAIRVMILGDFPGFPALFVYALWRVFSLIIWTYIVAIFIQVILSFLNPNPGNPLIALVYQLTEPLLRPIRRVLPPVAGFDLSPLIVIVGLQVLLILFRLP